MRRGSPFHSRTSAACESWEWRGWSGYLAASSYSLVPEMEYYAIRHSAGMLDVSPLYKYLIRGKDALSLVNKVVTRNARKLAKGQIYYTPWCDERGKTVDDGTLWNFGDGSFRMTSAEPNLKWLEDAGMGLDAEVRDVSEDIGALAVQGPSSRAILMEGADGAVQKLKYFRFVNTTFAGIPVQISRTGYTGDLGYEIWVERERAEALWDALMDKGRGHDITPAGMLALGDARVLVAAPQEIHCNRDGRSGVFPAGDARRYRPRGRVGTSPDPRDRRTATVLRSGSEEIVRCGITADWASEQPSSKITRNSGQHPPRFLGPDRRSGSRIPTPRSRRSSSGTRGGRTTVLADAECRRGRRSEIR